MTDMRLPITQRPDWVEKGAYGYELSYELFVTRRGAEIVEWETCGSYQGDHVVLVRQGPIWGFTVIGYGSCSGCDALQSAEPYSWDEDNTDWRPVIDLDEHTYNGITWDSRVNLAKELRNTLLKDGTRWYSYDEEIRTAVQKLVGILEEVTDEEMADTMKRLGVDRAPATSEEFFLAGGTGDF